jgi:hypothetical protein
VSWGTALSQQECKVFLGDQRDSFCQFFSIVDQRRLSIAPAYVFWKGDSARGIQLWDLFIFSGQQRAAIPMRKPRTSDALKLASDRMGMNTWLLNRTGIQLIVEM